MTIASALVETMAAILDREDVTAESSIFGLGGTSMHAELYARSVSSVLGLPVSFADVFENPTPADLAAALAARAQELPPILLSAPSDPHPVTISQARRLDQVASSRDERSFASYANLIVVATRLHGHLDIPALGAATEDVSKVHDTLRGAFVRTDGEWELVIRPSPLKLITFPADTPLEDVEAAVWAPLDYSNSGLARFVLAERGPDDHSLYVVFEHIVGDGESARILMEDLAISYNARRCGEVPRFGVADSSMRGYELGRLERRDLAAREGSDAISYWRDEYGRDPAATALKLPGLRPNDFDPYDRDAYLGKDLAPEVAERLRRLSRSAGTTLHVLMVWALARALASVADGRDQTIHWFVADRGRPEVERMVNSIATMTLLRLNPVPEAVDLATLRYVTHRVATSNALSRFRLAARSREPLREGAALLYLHVNPDPMSAAPRDRTWTFNGLEAEVLQSRPQGRPRAYTVDASLRFDGPIMKVGIAWRSQMLDEDDARLFLDAFADGADTISRLTER